MDGDPPALPEMNDGVEFVLRLPVDASSLMMELPKLARVFGVPSFGCTTGAAERGSVELEVRRLCTPMTEQEYFGLTVTTGAERNANVESSETSLASIWASCWAGDVLLPRRLSHAHPVILCVPVAVVICCCFRCTFYLLLVLL